MKNIQTIILKEIKRYLKKSKDKLKRCIKPKKPLKTIIHFNNLLQLCITYIAFGQKTLLNTSCTHSCYALIG